MEYNTSNLLRLMLKLRVRGSNSQLIDVISMFQLNNILELF